MFSSSDSRLVGFTLNPEAFPLSKPANHKQKGVNTGVSNSLTPKNKKDEPI
jgi:hypothetical protein